MGIGEMYGYGVMYGDGRDAWVWSDVWGSSVKSINPYTLI